MNDQQRLNCEIQRVGRLFVQFKRDRYLLQARLMPRNCLLNRFADERAVVVTRETQSCEVVQAIREHGALTFGLSRELMLGQRDARVQYRFDISRDSAL